MSVLGGRGARGRVSLVSVVLDENPIHEGLAAAAAAGSAARLAAKSADKTARGWSGADAEGALPDADLLTFEFGLFQVGGVWCGGGGRGDGCVLTHGVKQRRQQTRLTHLG